MKVLVILLFSWCAYSNLLADNVKKNIESIYSLDGLSLEAYYQPNPQYPADKAYPDLVIKNSNGRTIARYEYEGSKAKIKNIIFDKKRKLLAILVGWKTLHRAAGISGTFYDLSIYKLYRNNIIKLKHISGMDGYIEGGEPNPDTGYDSGKPIHFKYKDERYIKMLMSHTNVVDWLKHRVEAGGKLSSAEFRSIIENLLLSSKTLTTYNNIAYYLQKAGANEEAAYLLEKIIQKFPNRTVAYYNLGDAYWELGKKQKAIKAYTTYIEQMCKKGLQKKIPKIVLQRVSSK